MSLKYLTILISALYIKSAFSGHELNERLLLLVYSYRFIMNLKIYTNHTLIEKCLIFVTIITYYYDYYCYNNNNNNSNKIYSSSNKCI